jgi:hypothetical protein
MAIMTQWRWLAHSLWPRLIEPPTRFNTESDELRRYMAFAEAPGAIWPIPGFRTLPPTERPRIANLRQLIKS